MNNITTELLRLARVILSIEDDYWIAWRGNKSGRGRKAQILTKGGWKVYPELIETRLFTSRHLAAHAAREWGGGQVWPLDKAIRAGWIEED